MKREIVLGQLQPGQPLPEVDLADRFKLSRAPVREALIHLCREGLATSSPYGGYVVPEVSIQELKELYELRLLLEPAAAERAASNITAPELQELEKWIVIQEQHPLNLENLPLQIEAEVAIHSCVARASGNSLLARQVSEVNERFQRHHVWLFREVWKRKIKIPTSEGRGTHQEILGALKSGDPTAARDLMYSHIRNATQLWLQVYFGS